MTTPQDWTIVFYLLPSGDSPVENFVRALDERTQARVRWSIEQLRARNIRAREPLVKHIAGKLYELREESQTNIYRIFYFFYTGRRIVLLHGFQKKTRKTPSKEVAIAIKRMNDFIQRGGES